MARKRRSVEKDYPYYDPPEVVYKKITTPYGHRRNREALEIRNIGLMSMLYMGGFRETELVGGPVKYGILPGLTRENFREDQRYLWIIRAQIIKMRFTNQSGSWEEITKPSMYPMREPIRIPKSGDLKIFYERIQDHLDVNVKTLNEPLFNIGPDMVYRIVTKCTGEIPHYLRAMGFKLRYRLLDKNSFMLKRFSGHRKMESLVKYMEESLDDEIILGYKFKEAI